MQRSTFFFGLIVAVVVVTELLSSADAFGLPPMNNCCPPPCPPPCGGGCGGGGGFGGLGGFGRRKRQAVLPQLKTEETPCPQADWKKIIEENLSEKDYVSSVNAIQTAFQRKFSDHKFLVICSPSKESASKINLSSGGDGYCHLANEHISCQVASLSA